MVVFVNKIALTYQITQELHVVGYMCIVPIGQV